MPNSSYICPRCGTTIEHLGFTRDYTETIYGREYGTVDFDQNDWDVCNSETIDYDNYESGDLQSVNCPQCNHEWDCVEDFLEEAEEVEEDEENEVEKKPSPNKLGSRPWITNPAK